MDSVELARGLHPLEVKVLLRFSRGDEISVQRLEETLSYNIGQANQTLSWLLGKNALKETSRTVSLEYEITELGKELADKGTVEERLFDSVKSSGEALGLPAHVQKLGLEQKDLGSAFGVLSKAGALSMNADKTIALTSKELPIELLSPRLLMKKAVTVGGIVRDSDLDATQKATIDSLAKKRGASLSPFKLSEREVVKYVVTEQAEELAAAARQLGITGEEVNRLSPAMLRDGSWKKASFRPFNIQQAPARAFLGRRNAYCEFLDHVKDRLVGFGFEEFDGPLVETEFWNSDALFMPQFHSARDIHDVYYVKQPTHAKAIEPKFLEAVAAAHENGGTSGSRGWNYHFDRDFTRRLILRSQGTVMSAKTLHKAKIPGKYFGILRCFRYDQVDATHLSDFYQTEGIVLGDDVNLRNLLGLLKMFATELAGATEVKYVPGYFPFTEPSVEVHIKHPVLGWFELGGSGILRPEVTKAMGIDVPVLAWGLGIDRMALMQLGLSDLRDLFSPQIEQVRLRRQA